MEDDVKDAVAIIRAKVRDMCRGEYCVMRGFELDAGLDPDAAGYCIELPGVAPNTELFNGFVFWAAKERWEAESFAAANEAVAVHALAKGREALAWATRVVSSEEEEAIKNQKMVDKPEGK